MTIIDLFFYAVFISQIFLISYYYPKKAYDRNAYVLKNYPAAEYPRLYPTSQYADPTRALRKTMPRYMGLNIAIAILGLGLLLAIAVSRYTPSGIKENEQLMFIMLFFMLQAVPHLYLELVTYNWQKNMRTLTRASVRTADLRPRKLFDFISPIYIALAVLAFIGWVAYYFYNKGYTVPWDWQSYVTVTGMTGINLLFIALGYKFLRGKKPDPYQSSKDQHLLISIMVRVLTFASIIMSLQLIAFDAINQNGWDKFEPVVLSVYFQAIMIFGIGEILRRFKIKDIDFSVYKETPRAA